jgi:hypothetical protein
LTWLRLLLLLLPPLPLPLLLLLLLLPLLMVGGEVEGVSRFCLGARPPAWMWAERRAPRPRWDGRTLLSSGTAARQESARQGKAAVAFCCSEARQQRVDAALKTARCVRQLVVFS